MKQMAMVRMVKEAMGMVAMAKLVVMKGMMAKMLVMMPQILVMMNKNMFRRALVLAQGCQALSNSYG